MMPFLSKTSIDDSQFALLNNVLVYTFQCNMCIKVVLSQKSSRSKLERSQNTDTFISVRVYETGELHRI